MKRITFIKIHALLSMLTFAVLAFSIYLQYGKGLLPCPLCLMQRLCILLLLILLAFRFTSRKRARIVIFLQALVAFAGLFFSSRQLWLQSLPAEQVPICMPNLDILMHYFPWQTIVRTLFLGSGDCSEVAWAFMGLSLSAWSALYFVVMVLATLYLLWVLRNPLD
jgi:disulfide bond formation protein DsbB